MVAFCDLTATDAEAQIDAQMQFPRVRGVRQIVGRHAEEDRRHGTDALLKDPVWLEGLRMLAAKGLSFDLQLIPPQIPDIVRVLEQVPQLKLALCHCGSPWDQSEAGLRVWREGLRALAQFPKLVCKISGLGMFNPNWEIEDLRPLVLDAIEIFTPSRVMCGSNFPVDKLYRSYEQLWQAYVEITRGLSASEQRELFVNTAARFYNIPAAQAS